MSAQILKCLHAELKVLLHGIQNASMQKLRNLHVNFKIGETIIKNTMAGKGIQKIFP